MKVGYGKGKIGFRMTGNCDMQCGPATERLTMMTSYIEETHTVVYMVSMRFFESSSLRPFVIVAASRAVDCLMSIKPIIIIHAYMLWFFDYMRGLYVLNS